MSTRDYLIYLASYRGFGPATLEALGVFFDQDWSAVFMASANDFSHCGLRSDSIDKFLAWRKQFQPELFQNQLAQAGLKTCCWNDDDYPALLQQIHRHPAVLFYRGQLDCLNKPCLAVVGARRYSSYGQQAVAELVKPLASHGLTIISGLAIGIDTLAHKAALAGGGLTVAVPGSGAEANNIYPRQNHSLAEDILEHQGLIISEFPPNTPVLPSNFPRRNRIISGLAMGVLVVEAAEKSGSLITARWALEQDREVLALPGSLFQSSSQGCNQLIKQGAKLINCTEDILMALGQEPIKVSPGVQLVGLEKQIFEALTRGPLAADELSGLLNQDIRVITSALSKLQLAGLIGDYGGGLLGKI